MTTALAQKVGGKLFKDHIASYQPADPLYETYVDPKSGKTRQRRKVKSRAHYLDKGFSVCGMRFGYTFLIGLIPFAGDFADLVLNYTLVLRKARQAELPDWLVRKMLLNNMVSAAAGFIPVVGDVILATYKANSRNAALLEEFLRIRGEEFLKAEAERNGQTVAAVNPGAGREQGEKIEGEPGRGIMGLFAGKSTKSKASGSGSGSGSHAVPGALNRV
ncbi:hypothetical protein BOTBODRAFT_276447 [Botryobasidium botryosum FD-172 SS1]|uniref:DUF4112 domain-containing protein n=1 Tax=Botryobasidium botryosum (strain FD-172 SS1) TaxID=930990 RepID=A0A067MWL7_BOTB1|nr:hypothetical protein BOTBODRAFT_276447 [Botryobasidium botryosum FD-172 SS1]